MGRDTIEWRVGILKNNEISMSATIYLNGDSKAQNEEIDTEYVHREDYV
jgi:hypothetical protein